MEAPKEDNIDGKYIIKMKKGGGYTASVFLVKMQNDNKEYIAKILKDESKKKYFENETKYLEILTEKNAPNVIKYISKGEGPVIRKDRNNGQPLTQSYIILEHAPKRELADYIAYTGNGLGEEFAKLIFYEIMKGIQFIHEQEICHRDIKLENILLDNDFLPKIADFGFADESSKNLTDILGTEIYIPPELYTGKPYEGKKFDIFSLGQTLIKLTFGIFGFKNAYDCPNYKKIFNDTDNYWKLMESEINDKISDEFKNLFIKMISREPANRPTAKDILNDIWLKPIKEMKPEQSKDLKDRIKKEFEKREIKIKDSVILEIKIMDQKSKNLDNQRLERLGIKKSGGNLNEENFFKGDIEPEKLPEGLDKEFCIKINGYINPKEFMNDLGDKMVEEFADNFHIKAAKNKLKFTLTFIDNEEKENEKIKGNDVKMKIKLYESQNVFILKMSKIYGEKMNFYEKFTGIYNLVKNYLS